MQVTKLHVQGIRNVQKAVLFPEANINIIYGENGSGKTSLLEALYLLGHGRSFRTSKLKTAISKSLDRCTVFALLTMEGPQGDVETPVGVSRSSGGAFQFKVAGRQVYTSSQLAETIPTLLMTSESLGLIEGGPRNRRKFLDWGVFHVEHAFRAIWRNYQRCYKQRNNLLRHDKISNDELVVWDHEFINLSEQVAAYRQRYFDQFLPEFYEVLTALKSELYLDFSLYQGWREPGSLGDELKRSYQRDCALKTTSIGVHRADIVLTCEGHPAGQVLSRGQIKLVVLAMIIAQGRLLKRLGGRRCIYLLDDLAAELDEVHLSRSMKLLFEQNAQVFLTGTDSRLLQAAAPKNLAIDIGLFHVKQGEVDQVQPDPV